jgi:hypothetical protein
METDPFDEEINTSTNIIFDFMKITIKPNPNKELVIAD